MDGGGEIAQQLEAFAILKEDLGSVPRAHIGSLTATCNSSFRRSNFLSWPLGTVFTALMSTPHPLHTKK